jgi:excinuclease ABC subunit C
MIGEVVFRRFSRLVEELSVLPDVVLVDGGPGQLHATAEAVRRTGAKLPILVSLAKREEEVFVLEKAERRPLRLPRTNPALKILQAVRDEAHRFAQHYHHLLRRQALFGKKEARGLRGRKRKQAGREKRPKRRRKSH